MAPLSVPADRNLLYRILSGVVLGPLALALTFFGGAAFTIAVFVVIAAGLREWLRLVTGKTLNWEIVPLGLVVVAYAVRGITDALIVMAIAIVLVVVLSRAHKNPLLKSFGLPYVGLTMLSLLWLRDSLSAGWPMVFFLFLAVWASDIGAFIVGRILKGPRLAPKISPNKTWSGFFGGLAFAGAIAFIWTQTVMHASKPGEAVAIAVGLSLFAQTGDLFESAMKRRFNVKDSGNIIPGHGGVLDRIDALLFAAPVFALLHASGITMSLLP